MTAKRVRESEAFVACGAEAARWVELAAEAAGLGYWRVDAITGVTAWSDGMFRLLGQEPGGALEMEAAVASIDVADRERVADLVRRTTDSGEPGSGQFRQLRAGGSWRVFSNHAICERGPDGEPTATCGVVMDITEREIHRFLAERGGDLILETNLDGRFVYVSPNVTAITGYTPEECLGLSAGEFIASEQDEAINAAIKEVAASPGQRPRPVEVSITHKDGRKLWLESRASPLLNPATGRRIGAIDVARDITDRKALETKLEFANTVLKTQMEASSDGMIVADMKRGILSFNQRFVDMWGIPVEYLLSENNDRVMPTLAAAVKDPDAFMASIAFYQEHPEHQGRDDVEMADGRIFARHTEPLFGPSRAILGRAFFFSDVTLQRQSLAEALTAASRDSLTGLANRAVLVEALRREIAAAKRSGSGFAVIYLDLDHFKDVNDTLGHSVGDELLIAVAARLRSNTRETDTVTRLGGDEFVILVSDLTEATDSAALAQKLIKVIAEPFCLGGRHVYTGASIGIELFGPQADEADMLLSHADLALYQAKALGRGRYQFFEPSMDAEVRGRVTMAAELREAIADDQLFLVYQPEVCLATGRITGLQARIRWRHPRLGVLEPGAFIPVAKQMGLMESLGHWALWAAIRQGKSWLDADLPLERLCLKISNTQFMAQLSPEADIITALAETGFPSRLLELELTEAALTTATRENNELLPRLRRAGVTIAIDDFGTGQSSLHKLGRFPVRRIKIAEAFVRNLENSPIDAAIVQAAIAIARGLGIGVVATGIDTASQYEMLKDWGCADAQGPFMGGPVEVEQAPSMLTGGHWRQSPALLRR